MPRGIYPRKPGLKRNRKRQPLIDQWKSHVGDTSDTDACWPWIGNAMPNGYGRMKIGGRPGPVVLAHRISYELFVGPIPDGLHIDHLCRNRLCVNPTHLEAVLQRTNTMRGESPTVMLHRSGKCKRGHDLIADAVFVRGVRAYCKVCRQQMRQAGRWR